MDWEIQFLIYLSMPDQALLAPQDEWFKHIPIKRIVRPTITLAKTPQFPIPAGGIKFTVMLLTTIN